MYNYEKLNYFFVMAVIKIAGFATDDKVFETLDKMELKILKVPIRLKTDCYAVPARESD